MTLILDGSLRDEDIVAETAASTSTSGIVELATDAETITGTDALRAVTPAGLTAKVASETEEGIIEIATDVEALAETEGDKALVPSNLAALGGTATFAGLLELATNAETITGTDTERAVTADGVQAKLTNDFAVGGATLTPGAEDSGACAIQLTDQEGDDLAVRGSVYAWLSDDANGDDIVVTAPDGGVAAGTDGQLHPIIAGKSFMLVSEADGDIDFVLTESGDDTFYLNIALPDGSIVTSTAVVMTV